MEQVTKNVYTETKIRGCNPSIVLTPEGSVFVDTRSEEHTSELQSPS